jgi:hypothetical protein
LTAGIVFDAQGKTEQMGNKMSAKASYTSLLRITERALLGIGLVACGQAHQTSPITEL